jgi:hypothetical protein
MLERRLTPLMRREAVTRNHFFERTRTGVERRADFFADSDANVALDVLRLALQRADAIRERADAEAFKIYDVLEADNAIHEYVVFCEFGEDPALERRTGTLAG